MVTKFKNDFKNDWHGPGGKLFRKVLGKWSEATSREWDRICGSRKTAEADEKKPWIGKLWPKDAQGSYIRAADETASGERSVDSKGTNHNLKFVHQAAVGWKRLSKGAAAWEHGAWKNSATEREMLLKYARE
ncbi:MAG: hypothetical protein M1826_004382 [Phylliscum demangeonii]|nr:MAG: hypothetical protein M1826_004382 [Phylliscum demangeonii]